MALSHLSILFLHLAGKRLFQYLKSRNITGETGQVAFDDNGDRIYAGYDVINIREQQKKHVVGKFSYDNVSFFFFRILKSIVPY